MNTAEVLRKALELLGPSGENWHQGSWGDDETKTYCSMGAIRVATVGNVSVQSLCDHVPEPQSKAYQDGLNALQRHVPTYGEVFNDSEDEFSDKRLPIASYNDQPTTTFEDIQLMFKKAIHEVENDG